MLDNMCVPYEKSIAMGEEYKKWLLLKLKEEFAEFQEDESVEELADLLEVIKALEKLPEYKNLEEVRVKKAGERGVFLEGIILKGEKK